MEGAHDLGGIDGFGPVVTPDGEATHHEAWELRAQALALFGIGGPVRQWLERLDAATYLDSSYYVRWLRAAELGTVTRGRLSADDLRRWQLRLAAGDEVPTKLDPDTAAIVANVLTARETIAEATSARYAPGDAVLVSKMYDVANHHRCPRYVRGAAGRVEHVCGESPPPDGPNRDGVEAQYTVRFESIDLWGTTGEPPFAVYVDLFEHYLEPA